MFNSISPLTLTSIEKANLTYTAVASEVSKEGAVSYLAYSSNGDTCIVEAKNVRVGCYLPTDKEISSISKIVIKTMKSSIEEYIKEADKLEDSWIVSMMTKLHSLKERVERIVRSIRKFE